MPSNPTTRQNYKSTAPHRWLPDEPLRAKWLNETRDAVVKIQGGVGLAQQIRSRADATGLAMRQFRVVSVEGDYLRCESQDGGYLNDGNGDIWYVAKPYLLRRSPFDGTAGRNSITYAYTSDTERVATDANSATETQVIVPSYQAEDVIYAIRGITGGTGITITRGTETEAVTLLDLNVDGRAWARQ